VVQPLLLLHPPLARSLTLLTWLDDLPLPFLMLGLKMAIAATIVVITSVLAERSRPFIAAMIVTLPVSAGPALVFLALDHDDAFLRATLLGAMVTNLMTPIYCLAYAWAAQTRPTRPALVAAFTGWGLAGLVLQAVDWTLPLVLLATVVIYPPVMFAARRFLSGTRSVAPPRAWFALPLRALAVAGLVAAVTSLSWSMGPYFSGTLVAFPLMLTSLVVILQPRIGGPQTAALVANSIVGLFGFGFAIATAIAFVPVVGRYWALGIGLAFCLLWNIALVLRKGAGPAPTRPEPPAEEALPQGLSASPRSE
jgi:uncharacterized membrane protein (GlpM family)